MELHPLVKKVLFTQEEIQLKTKELTKEVSKYYLNNNIKPDDLIVVGLLKGSVPFYTEFCMNFDYQIVMDFMVVSSYSGGLKSSKQPKINLDVNFNIQDRHVLIVEDIVDTGYTLQFVKDYLLTKKAKSVKVLTLLDKPGGREIKLEADWVGFTVENEFVIGYGLDYEERLRNLPYVAVCDTGKLKDWKW